MGYLHIDNLYKNRGILAFRECYAMEKVHGTSAHVRWADGAVHFFSGGEKHDRFAALFVVYDLVDRFRSIGHETVVVFGEAYGGKQQGMSATYGPALAFVAFDVQIGGLWLSVPDAADVVRALGMEFVDYALVPTDVDALDAQRDRPSVQSVRNGMGDRPREGVVLRPPFEVTTNDGKRIIAKHKRDEFRETATSRPTDPEKLAVLTAADAIAAEWVTEMRLTHVLDKLPEALGPSNTPLVIAAMIEDVLREGSGEIVESKEARRAIGSRTAKMFKERVCRVVR